MYCRVISRSFLFLQFTFQCVVRGRTGSSTHYSLECWRWCIGLVACFGSCTILKRMDPRKQKLRVASQGRTLWRISEIFMGFYTPNYYALAIQLWHDSLHRLQSYSWEIARLSITPNFSVHPVGKTIRWIKNDWRLLGWARRALSPCKVWGRSYHARRL